MQANLWRSIPKPAVLGVSLAALLLVPGLVWPQEMAPASGHAQLHALAPRTPQELQELFKHTGEPLPLVSAHRGGPQQNLPENCLATFENTLRHTFGVLDGSDGEFVGFSIFSGCSSGKAGSRWSLPPWFTDSTSQ